MGRPLSINSFYYDCIVSSYLEGISLHALGRQYNVSAETIRAILIKRNIKIRASQEVNIPWVGDTCMIIKLYCEDKKSIKTIAELSNTSYKVIRKILLKNNIVLRKTNWKGMHSFPDKYRLKFSLIRQGSNNSNYQAKSMTPLTIEKLIKFNTGRKHSLETKNKMSQNAIGRGLGVGSKNGMRKPESIRKWIESNKISPNKKEKLLVILLDSIYPGQFLINVKGEYLILAGKIPDFVSISERKIIELFGDYWHRNDSGLSRVELFKKHGYDTLIIWERELKNYDELKKKIVNFKERGFYDLCGST